MSAIATSTNAMSESVTSRNVMNVIAMSMIVMTMILSMRGAMGINNTTGDMDMNDMDMTDGVIDMG